MAALSALRRERTSFIADGRRFSGVTLVPHFHQVLIGSFPKGVCGQLVLHSVPGYPTLILSVTSPSCPAERDGIDAVLVPIVTAPTVALANIGISPFNVPALYLSICPGSLSCQCLKGFFFKLAIVVTALFDPLCWSLLASDSLSSKTEHRRFSPIGS